MLLFVVANSFAQDSKSYDIAPFIQTAPVDTTPPVGFPYPTLFNFYYNDISSPQINAGTVGAMYFQNKFYLNRWNSTVLYRYNGGEQGVTTFADSVTYQGAIRDLTTDGTYLYGSAANATVYKMDANGTALSSITLASPAVARTIAYTPDEDGFYVSNFSDNISLCSSTTGAIIRTLAGTSALTGKYGMGYSNIPGDGPTLWVWGQGTLADPYNKLYKVNPQTGALIATYAFGPLPTGTSVSGTAGGAEVCQIGDKIVLLLNYQNYALVGYILSTVVPVELTSFSANVQNGAVVLNWATATETNNQGFEVQRKFKGDYITVGFINGNGTSTETHSYNFVDSKVEPGIYSYRLKQIDFSGQFEYSSEAEVSVNSPTEFVLDQNYPNPFNPSTSIKYSLAVDSKITLKVFNVVGQEVATLLQGNMAAGFHEVKFDASNLNSGVYFYRLEASGLDGKTFSSVKKMILTK
ncbi:MAG: T9SS type A sorting domain-containing protein [Ignavibacteriaceae bacterium]|nr:T9SS type A sorting domain-containing protein [Ignavibacteriaceae bacterium]